MDCLRFPFAASNIVVELQGRASGYELKSCSCRVLDMALGFEGQTPISKALRGFSTL
jgi:hypothetical protein